MADQFHFVCGNGSERKLTSLSYSLACLIESFLSQALKFPFMRLRPYSLIASKSFLCQMWVLCKESGYKLITLQKEAGGEKREEEVESKKIGNWEVKTFYKSSLLVTC